MARSTSSAGKFARWAYPYIGCAIPDIGCAIPVRQGPPCFGSAKEQSGPDSRDSAGSATVETHHLDQSPGRAADSTFARTGAARPAAETPADPPPRSVLCPGCKEDCSSDKDDIACSAIAAVRRRNHCVGYVAFRIHTRNSLCCVFLAT